MQKKEPVEYDKLLLVLRQLYFEKRTGTLFITTDRNRSVRMTLDHGHIISCTHGLSRGREAIPHIRSIKTAKYSFNERFFDKRPNRDLPSTREILTELGVQLKTDKPISSPQQPIRFSDPVSPDVLFTFMKEQLALLIGPLGATICDVHQDEIKQAKTAEQFQAAIDMVTGEINNPEIEEKLRKRIREKFSTSRIVSDATIAID